MYKKARAHFKKHDPKLHAASREFTIPDLVAHKDLFPHIVEIIVGQQLSSKAADTIFTRVAALFPKQRITPKNVLALPDATLRSAGLSGAKTRAIKCFAESVKARALDLQKLPTLSDEEVVRELVRVKGIGPWTAEMTLIFALGRTDVFSKGDLGLRKGIMHLYGLKKHPSDQYIKKLSALWTPYRTYAARILWRVADKKKGKK